MNLFSQHNFNLNSIARVFNFILLLSILFLGIGVVLIGAYFAYPNAEDLSISIEARKEYGFLISIIQTLTSYDGRYFTNVLHAINPLVFNSMSGYKWTIVGMFMGLIFSMFFLLRTLYSKIQASKALFFSFLSAIIIVSLVPSAPHFLFWMISGFVYLVPWIFLFLNIAFTLKYFKTQNIIYKNIWFVLASISLFAGIGLNEMFLPVYFYILIFGVYFSYKKNKLLDFLPLLIVGITSLYLFISSPGISNRLSSFTEKRDFDYYVFILQTSVKHILFAMYSWLLQNSIFIPFLFFTIINTPKAIYFKIKNISYVYIVIAGIVIFSMLIPYYYAMGVYYYFPKRIFSGWLPGFIFLSIFLLYFIFSKNNFLSSKLVRFKKNKLTSPILLFVLLISILFSQNNINSILNDFNSGALHSYKYQMENRYEIINLAAQANEKFKIAIVDSLHNPPKSIFHGPDIQSNRSPIWWNIAYEDYFYINEIKLKSDTTPFFIQIQYQKFLDE